MIVAGITGDTGADVSGVTSTDDAVFVDFPAEGFVAGAAGVADDSLSLSFLLNILSKRDGCRGNFGLSAGSEEESMMASTLFLFAEIRAINKVSGSHDARDGRWLCLRV